MNQRDKKKLKILAAALAAGLLIVAGIFLSRIDFKELMRPDAAPIAREKKAKLTLPAEMDSSTRLDDIKSNGHNVVYVMTILKPREEGLDRAGYMNLYLSETACKSEEYMKLLTDGYGLEFVYNYLDGKHLQTIIIQPTDCGLK